MLYCNSTQTFYIKTFRSVLVMGGPSKLPMFHPVRKLSNTNSTNTVPEWFPVGNPSQAFDAGYSNSGK